MSHQRGVLLTLPKYEPINLEFNNVNYTTPASIRIGAKKKILKNVSGQFNSGELTAIMGPSGAGKTSLLHILTGFITAGVEGHIKCNGSVLGKDKLNDVFRKELCYITQEDHLAPLFTVSEIMTICANLKLGHSLSSKAKQLLVEDILDIMGLTKCVNTRCGKLSGGQKKRLSIALELVDNPPIMFLDEPTTGLDSVSSLQCAKVLKALARGGRTIVCTIHQPCASIMELIDNVYILSDGQCVYQGASYNMLPYVKKFGLQCPRYHNPADFMMEIVTGEHGPFQSQLIEAAKDDIWKKPKPREAMEIVQEVGSTKHKNTEKTLVLIHPPSEFQRFWILFKCFYTQLNRDWTVSHLKIVLHTLIGALVGWNFIGSGYDASKTVSNLSFFYCILVYMCYTTMMPAILRFPLEREVVTKEQFNNWYKLKTYFMTITISNQPLHVLFTLAFVLVSYILSGQPMEWERFGMVLLISCLTTSGAEGFGLFFGTIFQPVMGIFFGALYTAFMLVFGGFLILFTHMSSYLYWISYISFFRYGFDGLLTSIYGYNRPKLLCPDEQIYCHLSNPELILKEIGVTGEMFWIDVVILIGFNIATRVVTYYILKRKVNSC